MQAYAILFDNFSQFRQFFHIIFLPQKDVFKKYIIYKYII